LYFSLNKKGLPYW